MKAARFHELNKPLKIEDLPVPSLEPNEVLVKTKACGICHTDLHFLDGKFSAGGKPPFVLGHEPAGVVEKVGEAVTTWKAGDRVIPYRFHTCGECYACRTGDEEVCYKPKGLLGFTCDGGFAEYFKWPGTHLLTLPDAVSFREAGPLACSGHSTYHAVNKRAGLTLGQTALINGCGGLGLTALQFAKLAGATVYVTDIDDKKLEKAKELGADGAYNPKKQDVAAEMKKLTEGLGVHVVIDFVGSPQTTELGLNSLRRLGKLILLGVGHEVIPKATPGFLLSGEYEILGCRSSNRQELKETVELVATGRVKPIVTKTFKLDEVNEGLEMLKRGEIIGRSCVEF